MNMKNIANLKKEISETGKRLCNKGFACGTSGNISVKFNNNILITPSGMNLGEVEEEDIVLLDLDGNNLENDKKPSSEKMMHAGIYKVRRDIESIIHVHPPKSTILAVSGIALDKPILAEAIIVLGPVPIAKYAMPSSDKLASIVAKSFLDHDAVLMANHGVVLCGGSLKETYYKLETLESYAEIAIWSKLLGNSNELSQENVSELVNLRACLAKNTKIGQY